jgi:hypothetical protein
LQIHSVSTSDSTDQPTLLAFLTPEKVRSTDLWIDSVRRGEILIARDGLRPNVPRHPNVVDFGGQAGSKDGPPGIILQATDGGSPANRIKLFRGDRPHKPTDRCYVEVVPHSELSEAQVDSLIRRFNSWIDGWREETAGLGLTSFHSNTPSGFRRKRLDWGLARRVINWLLVGASVEAGGAGRQSIG